MIKKFTSCLDCQKRETCVTPCRELTAELDKVTVKNRELPIGIPQYIKHEWPDPAIEGKKRTPRTNLAYSKAAILLTLIGLGYPRLIVAKVLRINPENMRWRIWDARKRLGLITTE
jgi:hypothetical protein